MQPFPIGPFEILAVIGGLMYGFVAVYVPSRVYRDLKEERDRDHLAY